MMILALEFSSPIRSAAVVDRLADGIAFLGSAPDNGSRDIRPLELVAAALDQAGIRRDQIEVIAVGLGPGSYTGVRSAIALAQGWHLGRGVRTIGIDSAECLAETARRKGLRGRIRVVIDAQRGDVCESVHDLLEDRAELIRSHQIVPASPAKAAESAGGAGVVKETIIGPEANKWFANGQVIAPEAEDLGRLAAVRKEFIPAENLQAIYLRATEYVKAPPARRYL